MRKGSVQEEILFMIFPELIAWRVIWAKMEASEAIVIAGAKRYSKYSGYSSKTKFEGIFEEKQPIDEFGRIGKLIKRKHYCFRSNIYCYWCFEIQRNEISSRTVLSTWHA